MMSDGCQGKEFSYGNSFLGLHSHHVYSRKPSDKAVTGKVSAQPHTIVKQICFPNGNVVFLSLFSLFKN